MYEEGTERSDVVAASDDGECWSAELYHSGLQSGGVLRGVRLFTIAISMTD